MGRTAGTARTSAGMSCPMSWPFGRDGYRRYGRPWRRWKPRPRRRPNRPKRKIASTRWCRMTRPSATSPMLNPASCPGRADGTSSRRTTVRRWLTTPTRSSWRHATNQTSDKQQAAAMMQETIDNVGAVPREVSADAGYSSAKAVGDLQALGVDPFVAPEQTRHGRVVPPAPRGRIPRHLSPRDRMRQKLQTRRGRALRPAHGNGGTGLRPDQAGPGLPAVPAAGPGEGPGRVVADLHRPQPAQAIPLRPTGPRMSTGHPANRARGMSTPPVGNDVPCTEPPRVSIVNRQE